MQYVKREKERREKTHIYIFILSTEYENIHLYVQILLDFAFYAKALPNRFKAGLLTCSIPYAFPSVDSGFCTELFLELTVARQSVIFTRFPFNSARKRNTLAVKHQRTLRV
jgi:hypothetical protein